MRAFLRFSLAAFGLLLLSALHIGLAFILPYPLSKLNIIFVLLIILLFWWDSGYIIWLSFFANFIIELYATTPFGILLFSGTISMLVAFWLYKYLFTNRSWYAAAGLGFLTIIIYRALYLLGLLFCEVIGAVAVWPWQNILMTLVWELVFSVPTVALFYFIISRFSRELKTARVGSTLFKV